jgi:signal transduction histidine kinase
MEASIETTTALGSTGEPVRHPQQPSPPQGGRVLDAESVERVSRYNFDELSRILSDRVGENGFSGSRSGLDLAGRESQGLVRPGGSLVSLGGETLVLNRLPLGILVFRDQQVLFANRAITEMIGYESVEALRNAGLASVFPGSDGEAGPVNHLVQRDGTLIPVTARLQSISWQGRPALMLSASATEVRTGHEAAVGAFANLLAETRGDGFIETSRAGVLSGASAPAVALLGQPRERLIGKPLTEFIDPAGTEALKAYLERPARFAETARPHLALSGIDREVQILLFAQGQAGTITGHFGFVRRMEARTSQTSLPAEPGPDAALLGRISRGVRRPLNTVIGFADLVGSESFGPIGNQRYLEYARDIRSAGEEIAALIDELDDYTRLKDGRYQPAPSDVDLASLLETCIQRIRPQANAARVLVRSAISERLPHVMADKPSLAQGVLNLLASAIDQTPAAGSVVLSAQAEDDGGVVVHVRDGAAADADLGERFVVFRDGIGRNGVALAPIRSSVGLALTRSLLAVNSSTLSVNPAGGSGTLLSLRIPESLVIKSEDVPG